MPEWTNGAHSKCAIPKRYRRFESSSRRYRMFNIFGKNIKKQQTIPKELAKQVKNLQETLGEATQDIAALKDAHEKAISKVGIVRFNPFGEIGGDQSFSIALLNGEGNGFVLTSQYGKDMNRVYAKPIKQGKSEYQLSEEEQQAIEKAKSQ